MSTPESTLTHLVIYHRQPYARIDLNHMYARVDFIPQSASLWACVWCAKYQQPSKVALQIWENSSPVLNAKKYASFITTRKLSASSYELTTDQANCILLSSKLSLSPIKISFTQIVPRGSDPETAWFRIQMGPWIPIQEGKKTKKKNKKKFHIWTAGSFLWRLES